MKQKTGSVAIKTLDFRAEFKDLNDAGTFGGYASVFGNIDDGGDIVERGAFQEMALTKDGMVRILYQHDQRQPIGKARVTQDEIGLHVSGQLALGIAQARNAYEAMKAGILDAMSIGYDVLANGSETTNAGFRRLKRLKLWELSLVTFGMNGLAKVDHVKAIQGIKTRREFEDYLRDAGFSSNQAKSIASVGWKEAPDSQPRDVGEEVKAVTERIRALSLSDAQESTLGGIMKAVQAIHIP